MMETMPLRHVADVRVSNVDKKSVEGEAAVRLCNYTDVYYSNVIRDDRDFMAATATRPQIERFRLAVGDTIFTKDSETADDIAIPTYVEETADDLVCGYHLAMLRPRVERIEPRFLAWAIRSDFCKEQFSVAATGVTRYGLKYEAMLGVEVPTPTLDAQRLIANFLDDQVSRIDEVARLRREQIAAIQRRLDLRADALIDEARQSAGWVRLKYRAALVTVGIVVTPSAWYADQGVPALRGTNVKPEAISLDDLVFLTEAGHRLHRKSQLQSGDVVVVRTGQAGAAAVVPKALDGINAIDILIVRPGRDLSPDFLAMCLNAPVTRELTDATVVGAIQGHFNVGTLRDVLVPDADRATQDRIADGWIAQRDAGRMAVSEMTIQVALLEERKRSLITAAVTGEFDVTTASGRGI